MKIVCKPLELKNELKNKKNIGFVPTMGALHEGHISLIKKARAENEIVVVSIFVNPTQFLKGEDFDKYPQKYDADKKVCELCGVDLLFYPNKDDMYENDEVKIEAPEVRGYVLEGATRVGHFSGMLRVVNKLLHIVNPTKAYFGKKDAQQLNLISLMVKQLFMDVEIIAVDTIRDADGLALSSRNIYLSKTQREDALKIPTSLFEASKMIQQGQKDTDMIKSKMREILSPLKIGYVEIVDQEFNYLKEIEISNTIILVEAMVGTTRLLDNIWI